MAKPIAGINDYPYGVCGFIVSGALLKDGTKLKNMRIYKQRSIHMFDLIDPVSNMVYQKVQLTGYNTSNRVLDYSLSDDNLLDMIPKNSFFVRGYNDSLSEQGFVIRFLSNKVVLSDGTYLYDMYTPECDIPIPDLGTIIVNTVTVDSTTVTGSVSAISGALNEDGMIVTLTTPEGLIYTTNVVNRVFTFDNVVFENTGVGTIVITSPHYNTATVPFDVLPSGTDTDFVTNIPVAFAQFVDNGDGTFTYTLPESVHNRGADLVVQIQNPNGVVYNPEVHVNSTGDISVTQLVAEDMDIVIIGPTDQLSVFSTSLVWSDDGSSYKMEIPFSIHDKSNPSVSVYDGSEMVSITIEVDSSDNITLYSNEDFAGKVVIAGKA
ncbi:putative structural protein [Erwinia phage pEa_SNUABM_12]|uniref:Putative structural protein n=1 Tax=Erwinia phage pEa_SNUABM_12 TaxID=2768773 RepID=A0A7L8ZNF8_9CAUD|nr:putative structural protein [Erwinia phage pEa_SNUABM_12]